MLNQNRRRVFLDLKNPRVQELSRKYNLQPKAVAYIRQAIGSKEYTKETLIRHIGIANYKRHKAIEVHKIDIRLTPERREKLIEYTMINIKFREGVVDFLRQIEQDQLDDILN